MYILSKTWKCCTYTFIFRVFFKYRRICRKNNLTSYNEILSWKRDNLICFHSRGPSTECALYVCVHYKLNTEDLKIVVCLTKKNTELNHLVYSSYLTRKIMVFNFQRGFILSDHLVKNKFSWNYYLDS